MLIRGKKNIEFGLYHIQSKAECKQDAQGRAARSITVAALKGFTLVDPGSSRRLSYGKASTSGVTSLYKGFTLVDPGSESGVTSLPKGFTLVELMIVVAILGILAAIVLPEFAGHIQQTKEAQAKANLRILREAIERYAADHNGVPPGYPANNITQTPNVVSFNIQLANNNNYMSDMPRNPFNEKFSVGILADTAVVSDSVGGIFGWLYKPATKEIRLDTPGTDSEGRPYSDY